MATWRITSSAGVEFGTYQGATAADALDAMARDAGYASQADAPVAFDGKVVEVRRFAVWGVGESTSAIVRSGEYDDAAIHASNACGWGAIDIATARESDAWYVVVTCDPDALDEQTRFDNSVAGYCEIDAAGKMVHDEGGPDVEVSEASAAAAHLAAGIAHLSAQPHGDGLAYYEQGTRAWYAVSESDVAELGRRLAADPGAYSEWCADHAARDLTEAGYAGETASDGPETLAAAPEPIDGWIVPPVCQGQIVTDAYGVDGDGTGWRRRYDASDRSTRYARLVEYVGDDWDPVNEEPGGTWRWVEVQS